MPQKTNLNINPYFDDFDKTDNFYKVLFKPGFPVQARELTTLQSILQNQVESFGSHIFKEGSMVIPGGLTYDGEYSAVKINDDHLGIDVSVYTDKLVGKRVRGQSSGIVAVVDKVHLTTDTTNTFTNVTLYVKYATSGTDNAIAFFTDGEILITEEAFTYGNTTISAGDTVATLISEDACSIGSSASIADGVYFIRGTFVDVTKSTIVLDPYTNAPSYRVGLTILEEVVTAKDDSSLYDNAKGFSNYAAPGADRLKITATLSKKALTDNDDKTFVELLRIDAGEIKKLQNKSQYSIIRDYFAKRTYEESGDYSVGQYSIDVKESLNDRESNEGVYFKSQVTEQGNTPSEDLMAVKVSAGKAYVRGYDIESVGTTVIDVDKPRDKETIPSALVPFEFGTRFKLNNVHGTPWLGVNNNTNTVSLRDQRRSSSITAGNGREIGSARIYSFGLSDAPYSNATSEFDLHLFDVQTYIFITLNSGVTAAQVPSGSYIQGVSSGASGWTTGVSTPNLSLTQTSGEFIVGEQIKINGTLEVSRSIKSVENFSIQDVKSVYQDTNTLNSDLKVDFGGDLVLQKKTLPGMGIADNVKIDSAGVISSPNRKTLTGLKVNDIVRYSALTVAGQQVESFNRVESVGVTTAKVVAVQDVSGVCEGGLVGAGTSYFGPITIGNPLVSDDGGLYARIDNNNVASTDLASSHLSVIKQCTEKTTDNAGGLTIPITDSTIGISSAFFENYDAERYTVAYSDGSLEDLTSDQVDVTANGSSLVLRGLTASQSSNVTVNVTVKKNAINDKKKEFIRSEKVTINSTVSAASTSLSGLSTSAYYGLRVQDDEISLNVPDVTNVVAVYESLNSSAPTLDSIEFPAGLNLDTASVLGEKVLGSDTGALAQVVTRSSATKVEIVYLNSSTFSVGEIATFQESNIKSTVQVVGKGNYQDVTKEYDLDKGQREQFYDYARLVKKGSYVPSRQLLTIFNWYDVPSNDSGDVYTVNSYAEERYKSDIPTLPSGVSASDILDFRPRVARFTSSTSSPFHFSSRTFGTTGTNPTLVVKPGENSLIGYDYYLPRIDKVVLGKNGVFSVIKGVSAIDPKLPINVEEAMDLAIIELPAYLYDTNNVKITLVDNKRYTMRDIGKIEDRVENLETVTSLSLLELETKSFQVRDADNLDRFKSGFFVDDFRDVERQNSSQTSANTDVENGELITPIDFYSLKPQCALDPSIDLTSVDFSQNLSLLDSNVQKTGDMITLKYDEKQWITQPLASRVENVNPFNMIDFSGIVNLSPASDSWVRNVYVDGGERHITGDFNGTYIDTIKTSSAPDTHIRSRNVAFSANGLRPLARQYPFFDGTSGIDIAPKLIEISMNSGVFTIGETVEGYIGSTRVFACRLKAPNHKTSDTTYSLNPYDRTLELPSVYSASSTVLNIDVDALTDEVLGSFFGYVTNGMTILGQSSGAQATVSSVKVIADTFGDIKGAIFFRDPFTSPLPPLRFTTGTKSFKLTSSPTNAEPLKGSLIISAAETTYATSGIVDTYRQTTVIVRRPPPPPPQNCDPLAQSFTVDETGAFISSVDLFFGSKDPNEKCYVEIRTVELGTPTLNRVADFARVELEPSQITTSTDGSVATKVTFPSPVYVQPGTEYSIVVLAPTSNLYELWVARMGERTVNTTTLPDAESVIVTKQYTGGSLFKSQNGTIWTASQFEDMKFRLYKCNFSTNTGTAYFYNPKINVDADPSKLPVNPITTLPRKLKIGITNSATAAMGSILTVGAKVSDSTATTGPSGIIESVGGGINATSKTLVGAGYSNGTHTGVPLYNITGSGSGAQATVVIAGGLIDSDPSITSAGSGYAVGDILGITTSNVSKGSGAQITVTTLAGLDTLYLTNVQGESFTTGQDLVVYNGATAISMGNTDVTSSATINTLYNGNVFEVNQFNHGMQADNNVITLADIEPNTVPTTVTATLGINDTTVSVADTTIFGTFEGISTSIGYAKVNNEILYYDSITSGSGSAGTLGISSRGVDSISRSHAIDDQIYPYELNGVGLNRINTNHSLPSDALLKTERGLDKYHIEIARGDRATGDGQLSFTDENRIGGSEAKGTRNIQYNKIAPQFNVITPGDGTTLSSQIRTVSGTSGGGSEISFIDQGFENVELNSSNDLLSPRIVASDRNENERLTSLPKNKSFTLGLTLNSTDSNLSPMIDSNDGASVVFARNRLNNPIVDYSFDGRVKLISDDPHAAIYATNQINLKQPASSLKVLIGAYRHSSADFRVLYKLFRADSSVDQTYQLFPGYDNLKDTDGDGFGDEVIDSNNNSGRSDAFVASSVANEFKEYQFSIDELGQFTGFQIKIVMSGTNEAQSPRFQDLRVIALA